MSITTTPKRTPHERAESFVRLFAGQQINTAHIDPLVKVIMDHDIVEKIEAKAKAGKGKAK